MIFKQLELTNFKSHQHNIINFNSGVTLIVGENGAGKSTIFEAISYALYKKYIGDKIDDLIRINNTTMSVTLTFITNGIEYKITRKRTANQSQAKLERKEQQNFITIAEGDKIVNQHIQEILDMDADLFLNAIYIRQGEIADLISKSPAERKQLIAKLLKLEELEKTFKNILPLINDYKWKQAEKKGKISTQPFVQDLKNDLVEHHKLSFIEDQTVQLKEILEKQQENIQQEIIQMEKFKNQFEEWELTLIQEQNDIQRLNKEQNNLKTEIKELEIIEQKIEQLKPIVEQLSSYINAKNLLDKIDDFEEQLYQIHECQSEMTKVKKNYDEYLNLQQTILDLKEQHNALQNDINLLQHLFDEHSHLAKTIKDDTETLNNLGDNISTEDDLISFETNIREEKQLLTDQIEDYRKKDDQLKKERTQLMIEKDNSQDLLIQIEQLDQQCPVCNSTIDIKRKTELIEHYNNIIQTNEKSITELNYKIDDLYKLINKLTLQLEDVKNSEQKLPQYRWLLQNIKQNSIHIKNMEESLSDYDSKLNQCKEIKHQINVNDSKIKTLQLDYDEYIRLSSILSSLPQEEDIKNQLNRLTQDSQLDILDNIEDINSHIEKLQQQNQEYNQLLGRIQHKESLLKQDKKISDDILNKTILIKELTNNIQQSLYNKEEYEALTQSIQSIHDDIMSATLALQETRMRLETVADRIRSVVQSLRQNEMNQSEYDVLSDFVVLLDDVRVLYGKDGVQKVLRSLSRPVIQEHTRRFFNDFNFNYSNLALDDEYNITLYGPEGEVKLDMISGGEKIAAALALRLGMTEAISKTNIGTILLDEPTIHLDSQRISELISLLTNLSTLPQMIIVTHDVELENAADNIIKVTKENGISNVGD